MGGMARDLIVQLCCEFYSTDEIARSKRVLFDNVVCTDIVKGKVIIRAETT